MAESSSIEWCDSTFNPWIGCTRVSPACDHCYAAVSTPARTMGIAWGAGQPRRRTSVANWQLPLRWNRADFQACGDCGWRGEIDTLVDDTCPGCGKHERLDPARRRVFCASLADVFDNEVPDSWRNDLFALIRATPNLDWLLLTKRIGNADRMIADAVSKLPRDEQCGTGQWNHTPVAQWPWPNVLLGATICNQTEADRDIPKLLALEARVRFLSMEPLLGPVDLNSVPPPAGTRPINGASMADISGCLLRWQEYPMRAKLRDGIDWVIVGGESGPHARPMSPDWARHVRDQCAAAGVPFLFKQWGEWIPMLGQAQGVPVQKEKQTTSDGWVMGRAGKKAAGRHLDGVEHTAWPPISNGDEHGRR